MKNIQQILAESEISNFWEPIFKDIKKVGRADYKVNMWNNYQASVDFNVRELTIRVVFSANRGKGTFNVRTSAVMSGKQDVTRRTHEVLAQESNLTQRTIAIIKRTLEDV